MASENPKPPDLNEEGDSPSKSVAPVCKENLDCGGKDAWGAPVVAQVTTSVEPKADVCDIPGKSEIVVDTTADDSPHNVIGIRHLGAAGILQVDGGLMGGPVGSFVAENVEEVTTRNTGKRPMTDQELPSSSSIPRAQVPKPRPSQGEFGKILQISQWSLTHRIKVCEILQDSAQHWRMATRSRHEYAMQSDAIVTSGRPHIEPLMEPPHPLDGFNSKNWESNLEKLEVEMEKFCFQAWAQLTTDLESKLRTSRTDDEKERWYVACREKGFEAQEIFHAVEEGNLEAFKAMMENITIEYWTLCPREYGGATPLHWAALHGQEDMVSFMLEGEPDLVARDPHLTIHTAAVGMERLVTAQDEHGFRPHHMALFPTLWPTYRYPEDSLAHINAERDELAMRCSHIMDSLFDRGANNDVITLKAPFKIVTGDIRDDSRAYFVASDFGDTINLGAVENGIVVHPLALATSIAHPSLVQECVKNLRKAAFEPITSSGDSVLHLVARGESSAFFEHGKVMTFLLSRSSKYRHKAEIVNLQNKAKKTPLHIAIASGNHECVAALLKSPEIEKDIPNENGHSPFYIARKRMEMFTKIGVVRDMVDLCLEHNWKFKSGNIGFKCKLGRLSRKDCDDTARKIFGLMTSKARIRQSGPLNEEERVQLVEHFEIVQFDRFSNVRVWDKQFLKILHLSQWSLTYRIYICKLLQKPFFRQRMNQFTSKEYAEQSLSLIKMNLQSDGNTSFASTLGEGLDWKDEMNLELIGQVWEKLASELTKVQDTLREKDTHENWYKAFEGKAFKPHEIFEAVELNLFPLAQWMMNQVTRSLLETDCTGISPREYRGATPLHWAMLHGNTNMVELMIEEANKLEGAFKATLINQDEFGFKPIHMAIFSSFMDECFLDIRKLFPGLDLNINENAYIGRSSKPSLFEEQYFPIKNFNREIFGANKVLSPIELAIYIAKEKVVEDLMVGFVGFVKPSNGDTLLHVAARGFNSECKTIMNLVLRHLHLQPNMLNSCNKDGETPLHIAIRQQKDALVIALLRCHYIKVDILNKNGLIPVQLVADDNTYIKNLIKNHPQDRRHMQLLQLSQWSLRHRILAIQMLIEDGNDAILEKIKDIYMEQCRSIVGGDTSRTGDDVELTDIANKLREELKELSQNGNHELQKGYISIEEGDYPMNIRHGDQYETQNKLDHLLHWYNVGALNLVPSGLPEYTRANWFHWATLHGRADMVDSICSKLKAKLTHKKFVPNDNKQKSEIWDEYETKSDEYETESGESETESDESEFADYVPSEPLSSHGYHKGRRTGSGNKFETQWAKIVDARDGFGFTPLHLVAFPFPWQSNHTYTDEDGTQKDVQLVEKLCENKFPHCASQGLRSNFMLWNCLESDGGRYTIHADDNFPTSSDVYPIQLALHMAHPRIMEKLLEKCSDETFVKSHSSEGTILHSAKAWNALIKRSRDHWRRSESILLKLLDSPSNSKAVNIRNNDRETPLHKAVKTESLEWVEVILQCEHIKFNLRDTKKSTPWEVALEMFKKPNTKGPAKLASRRIQQWFSKETPPKEIKSPLERIIELIHTYDPESMPQERETLQRERQVYVDAANAILVGAALIASASFGAWLQPPLGYQAYYSPEFQDTSPAAPPGTYESYVAIKQHWILQMFWIFNSLAFFFSLATVIAGADAAIPWQESELKEAVDSVRRAVKIASALLGVAIVFVICTFATLGFAILPPIEKYKINMWCTLAVGVVVCSVVLIRLLRKLVLSGSQTTGSAKPTQTVHITELS